MNLLMKIKKVGDIMQIIRGTTPTITINLEDGVTFNDLGNVKLRIKQGTFSMDKDPESVEGSVGIFRYTQEETLRFFEGSANIQLIGVKGTNDEIVNKSIVYNIEFIKSLWNESVHNE